MWIKCSKILSTDQYNSVFAAELGGAKLSQRELDLIGNTEVEFEVDDTLVGMVADEVTKLIENRKTYNAILTMEDLQLRYHEWLKAKYHLVPVGDKFAEWLAYEIEAQGIQIIQHPNPS